jgi:hypothetical protein
LQVKLHVRDPFPPRHIANRLGGRVYDPMFRTYLPESWKRERFKRWLVQHSEFFALDRGAAASAESFSDTER